MYLAGSLPYYRDITKMVLSLAIDAPMGPPRWSGELLERLNLEVLQEIYLGHPDEYELHGLKGEDVAATYNRYRSFFRALGDQIDGDWAWEDVDAGYLLLDGLALKDQSVSLGRLLLEDFAHYVVARKTSDRRVLLLVDEFSALVIGGTDAASLFERIRSYGASVVVTSQSYAGMGDGADRILGAAAAVLLHQCPDPEQLIARAGLMSTVQQRRSATERMGLGGVKAYATGQVALHERDVAKVRIEAVQQFEPGECVLIVGGQAQRLRVSQLQLGAAVLECAAGELKAQPRRAHAGERELAIRERRAQREARKKAEQEQAAQVETQQATTIQHGATPSPTPLPPRQRVQDLDEHTGLDSAQGTQQLAATHELQSDMKKDSQPIEDMPTKEH
jgi:hypothetical protein